MFHFVSATLAAIWIASLASTTAAVTPNTQVRTHDPPRKPNPLHATGTRLTPPTPAPQSCHATDNIFSDSPKYRVDIGVPYAGGTGCSGVQAALAAKLGIDFGGFTCKDDGAGGTALKFVCFRGRSGDINAVLHASYPQVNGFNCPDS
ncbi:hypothetical protein LTR53_005116 [Teratosphaeriaceae sp. CCFEE 6253]|nr:hypothetical protein LTR53_005116 [Teratosphaeriaceae sp. CCFEE 6253]